jgi:hypothetical protein
VTYLRFCGLGSALLMVECESQPRKVTKHHDIKRNYRHFPFEALEQIRGLKAGYETVKLPIGVIIQLHVCFVIELIF